MYIEELAIQEIIEKVIGSKGKYAPEVIKLAKETYRLSKLLHEAEESKRLWVESAENAKTPEEKQFRLDGMSYITNCNFVYQQGYISYPIALDFHFGINNATLVSNDSWSVIEAALKEHFKTDDIYSHIHAVRSEIDFPEYEFFDFGKKGFPVENKGYTYDTSKLEVTEQNDFNLMKYAVEPDNGGVYYDTYCYPKIKIYD